MSFMNGNTILWTWSHCPCVKKQPLCLFFRRYCCCCDCYCDCIFFFHFISFCCLSLPSMVFCYLFSFSLSLECIYKSVTFSTTATVHIFFLIHLIEFFIQYLQQKKKKKTKQIVVVCYCLSFRHLKWSHAKYAHIIPPPLD